MNPLCASWKMRCGGCRHRPLAAGLLHDLPHDGLEVAGFRVRLKLTLGARAFAENSLDWCERIAASQIVHDIIDEIEQLFAEFAHGDFGLFAEVDQIAF